MSDDNEWITESDELDKEIKQSARRVRRPRMVHRPNLPPVPLTEYNTCPFCDGKGFVHIIEENAPPPRPKW